MTKTALCIGINNYPGTQNDLSGCVNDANDWEAALSSRGFSTKLLLDNKATKAAMKTAITKLVQDAKAGDVAVITYSGHGSFVPDQDGDEADGTDEVLCPYDIDAGRYLSDDELYDIFALRERGAKIILLSDSCHSGTVMRFAPISFDASTPDRGRVRFLPPAHFLSEPQLARVSRAMRRAYGAPRPFGGVLISGCQDVEVSYDANFNNRPNGAFTYFALQALQGLKTNASYRDWFTAIRQYLPNAQYPQSPNLGGTATQKKWKIFA